MDRLNDKRIGPMLALVCVGIIVPRLAAADAPKLDGRTLGLTEAILNYCASIDPAAADRYRQQIKALEQGAGDKAIAEARGSEDYQKGRESMEEFIGQVDKQNAQRVCTASVTPAK